MQPFGLRASAFSQCVLQDGDRSKQSCHRLSGLGEMDVRVTAGEREGSGLKQSCPVVSG
jgi:hypothetical protein